MTRGSTEDALTIDELAFFGEAARSNRDVSSRETECKTAHYVTTKTKTFCGGQPNGGHSRVLIDHFALPTVQATIVNVFGD